MTQKKSKAAKIFIFITLIFIIFASFAVYIVMYAWVVNTGNNPCEEWYVLNEETWECEEEITYTNEGNINLENEESCTEAGWTWYEENNICILWDTQESNDEIIENTNENIE
jgi:hypothetical protein